MTEPAQTPLAAYEQQLQLGVLQSDPQQTKTMRLLQATYLRLIKRQKIRNSELGKLRRKIKPRPAIKGLYLWGDVGVGKTLLVDMFYDLLPVKKIRMHFFQFMQDLHRRLNAMQGEKDPLQKIAKELADNYLIICFDEFFVNNIADAMLLGELFKSLFKGGLCLVATSNCPPDNLYHDGIQRERFLPAIEAIKQHVEVVHLTTEKDYRRQHIEQAGVYYTPLNELAEQEMEHSFRYFSHYDEVSEEPITLCNRQITIIKQADKTIWFDFNVICKTPRSQQDYLALVKQYDTILVSNIPVIRADDRSTITLLINFIDILYDARTRLVMSAATQPEAIYPEGPLAFEFKRTCSRLIDMQSKAYFG